MLTFLVDGTQGGGITGVVIGVLITLIVVIVIIILIHRLKPEWLQKLVSGINELISRISKSPESPDGRTDVGRYSLNSSWRSSMQV